MSSASSFRKAATLNAASGRIQGQVRYDTTNKRGVLATDANQVGIHEFDVAVSLPLNGDNVDQVIYIANAPVKVVAIREAHGVAGNDAGAVTLDVKKCTGTQAPSAGTTVLTSTVNLKGTANTVVAPALTATTANLALAAGDRLALDYTGVITSLAGVNVTLTLRYV